MKCANRPEVPIRAMREARPGCCRWPRKHAEHGERERFEDGLSAVAEESPGSMRNAKTASPRYRAIASNAAARP